MRRCLPPTTGRDLHFVLDSYLRYVSKERFGKIDRSKDEARSVGFQNIFSFDRPKKPETVSTTLSNTNENRKSRPVVGRWSQACEHLGRLAEDWRGESRERGAAQGPLGVRGERAAQRGPAFPTEFKAFHCATDWVLTHKVSLEPGRSSRALTRIIRAVALSVKHSSSIVTTHIGDEIQNLLYSRYIVAKTTESMPLVGTPSSGTRAARTTARPSPPR